MKESIEKMASDIKEMEELRIEAACAKLRAGFEFRYKAFDTLVRQGISAEDAHTIAKELWEEV